MKTMPPCPSCPWRIERTAQDIPLFSLDKAERLAGTCPNAEGFGPDFGATWFACHQSRDGKEIPCAGWLAAVGDAHPGVRFAVMRGHISPQALEPGDDWPALHETFQQVIEKLRATA